MSTESAPRPRTWIAHMAVEVTVTAQDYRGAETAARVAFEAIEMPAGVRLCTGPSGPHLGRPMTGSMTMPVETMRSRAGLAEGATSGELLAGLKAARREAEAR